MVIGAVTLTRPVRGSAVLKYFGVLAYSLLVMAAVPFALALAWGEFGFAVRYGIVCAVFAAAALIARRLPSPPSVQTNEALAVVALVFLFASVMMAWPLTSSGLDFLDALFETVSGLTTTGLSILPSFEGQPPILLFVRAWTQWYGGLIIVTLALALLIRPGAAARRIAAGEWDEDLVGGTRLRARRILGAYVALTALGFLAIWALGVPVFDAFTHALAAVSTGGFGTHDQSLAAFPGWAPRAAVAVLSLSGAISFSLYWRAGRGDWRALFMDREVHTLVIAGVAVSVLLAIFMTASGAVPWGEALRNAPLMGFSAQTTTGFSTISVNRLDSASKLVLIVSMMIGGDMGSTAGGIKILRFLVVLRLIQLMVLRVSLPRHAVVEVEVAGRRLEAEEVQAAATIVFLFLALVLISWVPFLAAGWNPLNALFEVVSAASTTGLSTGIASHALAPGLKAVLCADMLLGRLEIVAGLVLLYPRTWFRRGQRET